MTATRTTDLYQALTLTRDETVTAYHCVAAVIRGFQTAPPPWAIRHLYDLLNTRLRDPSQFRSEHECCCGEEQSKPEQLLSSRQVAQMLGYSKQHVNRKAQVLGGVKVDGAWLFREATILEHLDGNDA